MSGKALCAFVQSGRQPRPGLQHPSGGLAETSLGKHGVQPRQGQCQALVSDLALTWALCSYTAPEVRVLVLSPVSVPGEGFVTRRWHRSSVKSDHGDIAFFQQSHVSFSLLLFGPGPLPSCIPLSSCLYCHDCCS